MARLTRQLTGEIKVEDKALRRAHASFMGVDTLEDIVARAKTGDAGRVRKSVRVVKDVANFGINKLGAALKRPVDRYFVPAVTLGAFVYGAHEVADWVSNLAYVHLGSDLVSGPVTRWGYEAVDATIRTMAVATGWVGGLMAAYGLRKKAHPSYMPPTMPIFEGATLVEEAELERFDDFHPVRSVVSKGLVKGKANGQRLLRFLHEASTYVLGVASTVAIASTTLPDDVYTLTNGATLPEKIFAGAKIAATLPLAAYVGKSVHDHLSHIRMNGKQNGDGHASVSPVYTSTFDKVVWGGLASARDNISNGVRRGWRSFKRRFAPGKKALARGLAGILAASTFAVPIARTGVAVLDYFTSGDDFPELSETDFELVDVLDEVSVVTSATDSNVYRFPVQGRTYKAQKLIRDTALEEGFDPLFLEAICYKESILNPRTRSSNKGAHGICQLKEIAVDDVNQRGNPRVEHTWDQVRTNPKANVRYSIYMHQLNRKLGKTVKRKVTVDDVEQSLSLYEQFNIQDGSVAEQIYLAAAYNYGRGRAAAKFRAAHGDLDKFIMSLPAETREYVPKVVALRFIAANYQFPTDSERLTGWFGTDRGNHLHGGIDVGGKVAGTPGDMIYAALPGKVVDATHDDNNGYYVTVKSPVPGLKDTSILSVYIHGLAGSHQVTVGDKVKAGDPLLKMGRTGATKQVHLHFTMKIQDSDFPKRTNHYKSSKKLDRTWYVDPAIFPEVVWNDAPAVVEDDDLTVPYTPVDVVREPEVPRLARIQDGMERYLKKERLPPPLSPKQLSLYREARIAQREGEYGAAIDAYTELIGIKPGHTVVDDCYLGIGDSLMALREAVGDTSPDGESYLVHAQMAYKRGFRLAGDMQGVLEERLALFKPIEPVEPQTP
jgi:murein DD-endopeptidase MepM/ murein hydrolase activator NlpD